MRYRLLIVDIDGTLVGKEGIISSRDKEALAKACRAGVKVSLCTGRVAQACVKIIKELSLDGYHIFFDGAFVGNVDSEEIYAQPLSKELVGEVVEFARQNHTYLELYSATRYFIEQETYCTLVHWQYFGIKPTLVDFTTIRDKERIIKGELFTASASEEELVRKFEEHFSGRLRFSWASAPAFPNVHFINVVDPRVSKGAALEALSSYLGIPLSQVMAVGDGRNDIPLLSTAGLAVAMGNARDELKSVADFVTLDIEQSGLAIAIDRFLLTGESVVQESLE